MKNRTEYAKHHYQTNKSLYIMRAKARNVRQRLLNRQNLLQYLLEHPCVDCKEDDPVVLEFDHITSDKTGNVGSLVQLSWSWQSILDEIAKCEVVCANCHRRRTAARSGNWHKAGMIATGRHS